MANSGYKNWLTLRQYVNGVATDTTKTNTSSDPDYIAPVLDEENCPQTPNNCPTVASAISDVSVTVGAANQSINLDNVFNDVDGDTLTYTATSSNTNIATVSINTNLLSIVFAGSSAGSSTINVTANDGTCSVTDTFVVTINEVAAPCNTGLTFLSLFSGATAEEACALSPSNIDIEYANGTSITSATNFYSDLKGCEPSPAKFLSDGTNWVELNSSGVKINSGLCETPDECPSYFTGTNYSEVSESQPYLRLGGLCTTEDQIIYYSEAWIDITGAGTNVPTYYSLSESQSISLGCPVSPIGYNGNVISGGTYTGDGGTITVASGNTLVNHGYIWGGNSTYVADNGWTVFSEWDDYGIVNVFFMPNCETVVSTPTTQAPTAYTGLTRCDNNSVTWYTNHEVQHADGTYKQLSSGSSFYSAGQECYISTGTTYDISGKTFIDGTGYNPYSGGPCDCDCYNYNC